MSEDKTTLPVGALIEDPEDGELGLVVIGENEFPGLEQSEPHVAWLCDAGEATAGAVKQLPIEQMPDQYAALRELLTQRTTHVFALLWVDDGVPNVQIFADTPELVGISDCTEEDAMRAITAGGDAVDLGGNRWLRFCMKV